MNELLVKSESQRVPLKKGISLAGMGSYRPVEDESKYKLKAIREGKKE